ncbi:type II toxin-antitoxin system VapC family toxin [Cellulomonas sp. KRMCY2]|uniref:type II toxin-antitoxin system VapC family toxin n=1 Tax=Cellulomonas sp. KRMCY2 TaxID=1304865 RepID=UPI00045EBC48|nr:type II toxin-antitoxin system VapC family toxin [Cellulomonas sp. KRMCY2]
MKYLLDTNALVDVLRAPGSAVEARLRECDPQDVGLSAVVLHELYYGAHRSHRAEHNAALIDEIALPVVDLTREDARGAGRIRAHLAREGRPIGPFDVLIAGQAVARGLVLVTHKTAEFSRVPGLTLADWTR